MSQLKYKRMAFLGFIGGVLYQIGDYFLFLHPEYVENMLPQACWISMPMWRFTASVWCALVGSVGLCCGFYSLYQLVKETCGKFWQVLTLLSLPGVLSVSYAHFVLGSIQPMIYKSMLAAGLSDEQFLSVNAEIMPANMGVTTCIVILFYLQLIVVLYGVISRRFKLSKRAMVLLVSLVVAIFLIAGLSSYLPRFLSGITGGLESLFEGIMYLVPFFCWSFRTRTE